jgi:protein TonB
MTDSTSLHAPPQYPDAILSHLFASAPAYEKDATWTGAAASLFLHGALLALILWLTSAHNTFFQTDIGAGTGISAGAAGGGGGGGEDVAFMQLTSPPPAAPEPEVVMPEPPPPVPPPIPVPTPEPVPEIKIAAAPTVQPVAVTGNGAGTASQGSGAGVGPGVGPGSGGGTGGGEGPGVGNNVGPGTGKGRILAPYPEFLLIPPTAPGSVRGKTVVVRLAIDETGTVRDVALMPATGDRGYDKELRRVALGWKFKPARDPGNNPVAVQYDVTFSF